MVGLPKQMIVRDKSSRSFWGSRTHIRTHGNYGEGRKIALVTKGTLGPWIIMHRTETVVDMTVNEEGTKVEVAPPANPAKRGWLRRCLAVLPLTAGLVLPMTGALNAQSAAVLGSSYWAVATAYTVCCILTVSWASATGNKKTCREGFNDLLAFLKAGIVNYCCLLGGVFGSMQNIISAEVSPVLGTGLMTTGILLGQIIMSMICDASGFAWAKKIGVHQFTLVGGIVVMCGCVLYRFALLLDGLDDGREDQASVGKKIGFIVFALFYGVINCIQAGVGGQMGRHLGHFRRAAAWGFSSGMVICYIVAAIENPNPRHADIKWSDWWKFCGGPISVFYTSVSSTCPQYLSFSAVFACIIAGQLIGSTILDANGWLGLMKRDLDLYNIFGIIVVMLGVVLVTWGKRKQMAKIAAQAAAQEAAREESEGEQKNELPTRSGSLGSSPEERPAENIA